MFAVPTGSAGIQGLAVDSQGDVWVASTADDALYGLMAGTRTVQRVAEPAATGLLPTTPTGGVAFDPSGDLYFEANDTVYGMATGTMLPYPTRLGCQPATQPVAVAADAAGNVYLDDGSNSGFVEIKELPRIHPAEILPGTAAFAEQVATDPAGDVAFSERNTGAFQLTLKAYAPVALADPDALRAYAVAFDRAGDVYQGDRDGSEIIETTPSKNQIVIPGPGIGGDSGIGVDGSGNLYAVESSQVYELVKGSTTWNPVLTAANAVTSLSVDGAGDIVTADADGLIGELTTGTTTLATLPFVPAVGSTAVALDGHGDVFAAQTQSPGPSAAGSGTVISELAAGATSPAPITTNGLPEINALAVDGSGHLYATTNEGVLEVR